MQIWDIIVSLVVEDYQLFFQWLYRMWILIAYEQGISLEHTKVYDHLQKHPRGQTLAFQTPHIGGLLTQQVEEDLWITKLFQDVENYTKKMEQTKIELLGFIKFKQKNRSWKANLQLHNKRHQIYKIRFVQLKFKIGRHFRLKKES